jgi:hypothetical protein
MVRRADLLNKNKRGRIVRGLIPEEAVAELGLEEVDTHEEADVGLLNEGLDLSSLTVKELRSLLEERGLDSKGKKADLLERLSEEDESDDEEE